jgi:hypothetical protein
MRFPPYLRMIVQAPLSLCSAERRDNVESIKERREQSVKDVLVVNEREWKRGAVTLSQENERGSAREEIRSV